MTGEPVDVGVPGDKSITHRALILAALATGESRLDGLLDAADSRATAAALEALGTTVGTLSGTVRIRGGGLDGFRSPERSLDCGNSGTTARLLLGALAGSAVEATLTGDASLRSRPMRRVTEPLRRAGAVFEEVGAPDRLPVRVHGARPLAPLEWRSPQASAQVKSALLLAGLTGSAPVRVTEPLQSRDHTERMLRAVGVAVDARSGPDGHTITMEPPARLQPLDLTVPGDPSAAFFFLAFGAMVAPVRVRGVGLNPTRTGALRVLERMGAVVRQKVESEAGGEPVGEIVVEPGDLVGTHVRAHEIPALIDEVPMLAVLAARARGETRFDGVAELRVKESDRIAVLDRNLRALGVDTEVGEDHFAVRGGERPLRGEILSHADHRIAMAFGVAGAVPGNRVRVHGGDAVETSFPRFEDSLERLTTRTQRT